LQEASRLRAALGGPSHAPRILIKRDDLTGLAFGGNKVRKLEFLVGDAVKASATALITAGAAQSNHARVTAAAAVVAGMKSVLVLATDDPAPRTQGNLLLDRMLGAEIHFVSKETDRYAVMDEIAANLRAKGETPYVIPVGGSNAIGAAGYTTMMIELCDQLAALKTSPTRIYFASGSGGTQAGIAMGAKALEMPIQPFGILDSPFPEEKRAHCLQIANEAAELVGSAARLAATDMIYDDHFYGIAYGVPTAAGEEAIRMLAQCEALFLDSVYSGKAMSGLIDHVRSGQIGPAETVVFVHTGGTPALFADADRLAQLAAP
jgi:D-cysteine desulfhydrase family pyridoxal phosphate-dependent enzyme